MVSPMSVYRMARRVALLLPLLASIYAPSMAQTIVVRPDTLTNILNGGPFQNHPRVLDDPASPTGKAIGYFDPISYAEFPVTIPTSGVYNVKLTYGTPDNTKTAVIDLRSVSTNQHTATDDISLPSTGGFGANTDSAPASLSLLAGDYVLRVQNVTNVHTTTTTRNTGWGGAFNFGQVVLTRTGDSGNTGTVSGVVSGDVGVNVAGALVMAVAAGHEVAEPGPFWYRGYWTVTDANGGYSLTVPQGTYTIQAGRPDMYAYAGTRLTGVLVNGPITQYLSLTSRWSGTTVKVEDEYYSRKVPDSQSNDLTGIALIPAPSAEASNNFKCGWIDPGDWLEVYVDVPPSGGGFYNLTSFYTNGGGTGTMSFTTDRGSATTDTQPAGGWNTTKTKAFAKPLYLFPGANRIRQQLMSGASDMDAFSLTRSTTVVIASAAFTVQPGTAKAGQPLQPQPSVTVQDASGNTVTAYDGPITLTLTGGPAGAHLLGKTTVNAVNGVATFTNVAVDQPGSGYVLSAGNGVFPSVQSAPFTVMPSGPPAATVALSPRAPTTNQVLTATATASGDPTLTIKLTYVWKVNGVTVKTTGPTTDLSDTLDLTLPGNGDRGDTVSVTVTPTDGILTGDPATDTVTVANAVPVASSQNVFALVDTSTPITLSATDADGDPLTYTITVAPSHGTLAGSGKDWTYQPAPGYTGMDSLTFVANDGLADSNAAVVSIAVSPPPYDDFSAASLDPLRWDVLNEQGTALATPSTSGGILTLTSAPNRSGVISRARLGSRASVQVTALGYTGVNQILQLYSGSGGFTDFIEYGIDGATNGTPNLHVWLPTAEAYSGPSPVPGPVAPDNPTILRIDRDGTSYSFYANNTLVFTTSTPALGDEARVILYGYDTGTDRTVSHWDNVALSGPSVLLTSPAPGTLVNTDLAVQGVVGADAASWTLDAGAGDNPSVWTVLATGAGAFTGTLANATLGSLPLGAVTLRLRATDAAGNTRSYWVPIVVNGPTLAEPIPGQVVGPGFPVLLTGDMSPYVRAVFLDNGEPFADLNGPPYLARRVPSSDGPHTITVRLFRADNTTATLSVNVIENRLLYGSNTHLTDNGRAFVFPDGSITQAIGENDAYTWPGLNDLYLNGNVAATESYVANLRANGVNVMRVMLETAASTNDLLENPVGTYNTRVVSFWDQFLAICERQHVTVLIMPYDPFWMDDNWATNPYNAANGGPCVNKTDMILSPAARAAEKARLKFMIDRWGNSSAIFAIDVANESDLWWGPVTPEQRRAWVDDLADYVQSYELQKWGHRHMTTVSTAAPEPTGVIGDYTYRDPRFEFANTHQYYPAVQNPQVNPPDIITPALQINTGTKASLSDILDGRPFTDSETGPIALSPPWLTNYTTFDNLYYHEMTWAHFATGGAGTGMRWPYRDPHILTAGMHQTQKAVAAVAASVDWTSIRNTNADNRITAIPSGLITMGTADNRQAVVWVTQNAPDGNPSTLHGATLTVSGMDTRHYVVRFWNTNTGAVLSTTRADASASGLLTATAPDFSLDIAMTVSGALPGDVDGDNQVTEADAALAVRFAAGLLTPTPSQKAAADVLNLGRVAMPDAVRILRAAVSGTLP